MRVSAIVSTYQRREMVLRTVASLLGQEYPASHFEIVVVIDGSTDGTDEALRGLQGSERLLIVEQKNRGLAAARNAGVKASSGELILFLDDDMLCEPQLVRAHADAHPKLVNAVGMGAIYAAPQSGGKLAAAYFEATLGAPYLLLRNHPEESWPTEDWSFGNTSIARELLERAGGFDEAFRMREDGELGVRLLDLGVARCFVAQGIAHQAINKSAKGLARDAEAFADADLQLIRKHPGKVHLTFLERIQSEPKWKRRVRNFLATRRGVADLLLAPLCFLGEAFHAVPTFRAVGLRALHVRCGLHWYGRLLQLTNGNPRLR